MAGPNTPSERRDDRAVDRDDAAEGRDRDSLHRDVAATHRDTGARVRDERSADRLESIDERLERIRRRLLAGVRRVEEIDLGPADWPDLEPAVLAQLRARLAEQGRLAALDGNAVLGLFDEFADELRSVVRDRVASAGDRVSSAGDRRASQRDRNDAAADRDASAGDRDQATIEREQADPAESAVGTPVAGSRAVDRTVLARGARAVQDSRRLTTDSRTRPAGEGGPGGGAPAAAAGADPAAHPD